MDRMRVRSSARALGITENTIRRWEQRGLIPAMKLPSGVRRFRRVDIGAADAQMYEGLPPLAENEELISVGETAQVD